MRSSFCAQEASSPTKASSTYGEDDENTRTKFTSQSFLTQVSLPSTPTQKRQPLKVRQLQESFDNPQIRKGAVQAHTPHLSLSKDAKLSAGSANGTADAVECITEQTKSSEQTRGCASTSVLSKHKPAQPSATSGVLSTIVSVEHDRWPGGRTRLTNGRHLPRYLVKITKDQEEILESSNAWQPSRADRQIHGSIPNNLLSHITDLADKPAEIASDASLKAPDTASKDKIIAQDAQFEDHNVTDASDSVSQSSASTDLPSQSWSPTPPAGRRSLRNLPLPEHSSPLRPPPRKLIAWITSPKRVTATADESPEPELSWKDDSTPSSPTKELVSKVVQEMQVRLPSTEGSMSPPSFKTRAEEPLFHKKEQYNSSEKPLNYDFSSDRSNRTIKNTEASDARSVQTEPDSTPEQFEQVSVLSRIQDKGPLNLVSNCFVQVHRTPFAQQPFNVKAIPTIRRQPSTLMDVDGEEPSTRAREPSSSASIVPNTFVNVQTKQCKQAETPNHSSISEMTSSHEDGPVEEERREPKPTSHLDEEVAMVPQRCASGAIHKPIASGEERLSENQAKRRKRLWGESTGTMLHASRSSEDVRSCSSLPQPKRLRTSSTLPSLDALKSLGSPKPPSEIARESRRAFINQQRTVGESSPPSTRRAPVEKSNMKQKLVSPGPMAGGLPQSTEQRYPTSQVSLLSASGSEQKDCKATVAPLPQYEQSMYERYKAAYPEYQADLAQFQKACKQIKFSHSEGKAPHPSLWDDFIFRRHHDYRAYLVGVAETSDDALPYLRYYSELVEKPLRMQLVIDRSYILTLGTDAAIGSSVASPSIAKHDEKETRLIADGSVAASSSASNVLSPQLPPPPEIASNNRLQKRQHQNCIQQQQELQQGSPQGDSVKQWVEGQSVHKILGAESPELGSVARTADEEEIPAQNLDNTEEILASPSATKQGAASQPPKEAVWSDDPDTPFKCFARVHTGLVSERSKLFGAFRVDGKGCLEPQVQRVIDIFRQYRK